MCIRDRLTRRGLEAPQDWQDLLKPEYQGLIWLSNYNTAGTAKLVINTCLLYTSIGDVADLVRQVLGELLPALQVPAGDHMGLGGQQGGVDGVVLVLSLIHIWPRPMWPAGRRASAISGPRRSAASWPA